MTPRKPRGRPQGHHRNSSLLPASDYESDIPNTYTTAHVAPPTRTNTELNISVLRRYNPSIRSILSIAANAVVYIFTPSTEQWEKSGVEGTLFVCDQELTATSGEDSYCIVVFNRRGLENLILDLGQMQDVELTAELLTLRFSEHGDGAPKVMGIWIHADKDDTRELNASLIQQCWERARASGMERGNMIPDTVQEPESVAMGRRISLRDLFQHGSMG
jgi:hypothetical protein